jgi:hypothetical protein
MIERLAKKILYYLVGNTNDGAVSFTMMIIIAICLSPIIIALGMAGL